MTRPSKPEKATEPTDLDAVIARVKVALDRNWDRQIGVFEDDLRALIDAARQAGAWREVALAERERCATRIDEAVNYFRLNGPYGVAQTYENAAQSIRALPAPTIKET